MASTPPMTSVITNAEIHDAATDLLEAMDARRRLLAGLDSFLQSSADELTIDPDYTYDPLFIEEFKKRLRSRFDPAPFIAAEVTIYEAHFTAAELRELAQAQRDRKDGREPELSQALGEKLATTMMAMQRETLEATSELGAKLSAQIAQELRKEHPEWFKLKNATTA